MVLVTSRRLTTFEAPLAKKGRRMPPMNDPHKDLMQGRVVGHDPADDPTQGRELSSDPSEDPTEAG
jgi:hypothetical protein